MAQIHKGPDQFRRVFYTWNNPPLTLEELEAKLRALPARYWCCSAEIGEKGTPHYHFYVEYRSPTNFKREQRKFFGAHIKPAEKDGRTLRDYIAKTGKHENGPKAATRVEGTFKEDGQVPKKLPRLSTGKEGENDKKEVLFALVEQGYTTDEIIQIDHSFIYRAKLIDDLVERRRRRLAKDEFRDVKVIVLAGPTGVGKTKWTYKSFDSVCRITSYREKGNGVVFDAMDGQECLFLDEFNSQIPVEMFNTLTDRYPLDMQSRFYDRCATYTTVVVATNRRFSELYEDVRLQTPEVYRAFLRRITEVRVFGDDGSYVVYDGDHAGEDALRAEGVEVPKRDWLEDLKDQARRGAEPPAAAQAPSND